MGFVPMQMGRVIGYKFELVVFMQLDVRMIQHFFMTIWNIF